MRASRVKAASFVPTASHSDTIRLVPETVKEILRHKNEPLVHLSMTLPRVAGARPTPSLRRLQRHYQYLQRRFGGLTKNALCKSARKERERAQKGELPFVPYLADLQYTESFNAQGFVSLFYDRSVDMGGVKKVALRGADTWDVRSGGPVTLSMFFPEEKHVEKMILNEIVAQARRRTESGVAFYFEDLRQNMKKHFDREQFYLTPQGLVVFYQPSTVTPAEYGVPEFLFPKEKLGYFPPCQIESETLPKADEIGA